MSVNSQQMLKVLEVIEEPTTSSKIVSPTAEAAKVHQRVAKDYVLETLKAGVRQGRNTKYTYPPVEYENLFLREALELALGEDTESDVDSRMDRSRRQRSVRKRRCKQSPKRSETKWSPSSPSQSQ